MNYLSMHESTIKQNREYLMRVLNKKYWPHHITVSPVKIADAERWCYENFKSKQWRSVGTYFAFKSGADATVFTLRWS
jgi:hypothetical protein